MELEQQQDDSAPSQPTTTTSSQSKKPERALRQPASKDKAQPQGEVKPRPRPRYSDKARKNAKNKKDKAEAGDQTVPVEEEDAAGEPIGDTKSDEKEDRLQSTEINGQPDSTNQEADPEGTSLLEAMSIQEDEEEDSWDTLFNDDGDFLDPHLLEEVSACTKWEKN